MTVGLSTVNTVNAWLNVLSGDGVLAWSAVFGALFNIAASKVDRTKPDEGEGSDTSEEG